MTWSTRGEAGQGARGCCRRVGRLHVLTKRAWQSWRSRWPSSSSCSSPRSYPGSVNLYYRKPCAHFLVLCTMQLITPCKACTLYLNIVRRETMAKQRQLKADILTIKSELLHTSAQEEFAKWAKLRRKVDKGLGDLELLSACRRVLSSQWLRPDAQQTRTLSASKPRSARPSRPCSGALPAAFSSSSAGGTRGRPSSTSRRAFSAH